MQPTVRFAEPLEPHRPQQPTSHASLSFRLPSISQQQQPQRPLASGSPDAAASSAIYDRHGYSPPRSPKFTNEIITERENSFAEILSGDPAGQWKYPLPSKSFRLYVGPPRRQAEQPAGEPTTSLPVGRTGGSDIHSPGLRIERSRTEPVIDVGAEQRQQLRWLPTPYVQSRAEIFLRRRFPPPPMPASSAVQPARLRRETTEVTTRSGDDQEAERLRWTMSTQRHWQVDRKGQQRNQGPFSREFTVHVTAPSNWMRMKWGRKQLNQDVRTAAVGEQRPSYLYTKQAYGQQQGF